MNYDDPRRNDLREAEQQDPGVNVTDGIAQGIGIVLQIVAGILIATGVYHIVTALAR